MGTSQDTPTISLTIDGRQITAAAGANVLEAALEAGIFIPHLCWHPDLPPADNCKLCVVAVENREGTALACMTPAEDGMAVVTTTEPVQKERQQAIVDILTTHPADCGTCVKYLNCELQSLKQYFSTDDLEIHHRGKLLPVNLDNPLFDLDPNKCVACGRCVRACRDLRGVGILDFQEKNGERYAGTDGGILLAEAGCRFCGACAEVCPTGAILDKEDLTKGMSRKAALVPCRYTCPAEIDVPAYVRAVREGDAARAAAIIREKAPFPAVLGYVCDHPCETACKRGYVSEAISIRELKRFAAGHEAEAPVDVLPPEPVPTGKTAAIVGSGPAGLTAAWYLARLGHAVTVYEARPLPGGMLRDGIPDYRLPKDALDGEIERIKRVGIDIKTGVRVKSAARLLDEGYDAVLISVGTHRGQKLPVPGADNPGVTTAIDFLQAVNEGNPPELGEKVVILGGGSVAFDCARTARRLGAKEIEVACLEPCDAMLADPEEVAEAEEEGIVVHPATAFTAIETGNGAVKGVICVSVASFELDEDGAAHFDIEEGTERLLAADAVIFAVGQKTDLSPDFGLGLTGRGYVTVDEFTLETSLPGVFAAGDAVTGTSSVIKAIAAGRKTAAAMDRYLGGMGILDVKKKAAALEPNLGKKEGFAGLKRAPVTKAAAAERVATFDVVTPCFTENEALAEAERCLQCDLRTAIRPVKFWSDYT
jgi:formate dehydrogenase beta subunit